MGAALARNPVPLPIEHGLNVTIGPAARRADAGGAQRGHKSFAKTLSVGKTPSGGQVFDLSALSREKSPLKAFSGGGRRTPLGFYRSCHDREGRRRVRGSRLHAQFSKDPVDIGLHCARGQTEDEG